MNWMIEWKEYDPLTGKTTVSSDTWETWEDVIRIVHDCMNDVLCRGAKVYQFGSTYASAEDKIVLEYCP